MDADVLVIGGGIVGLATARALLQQRPDCRVLVIDKETTLARHQSGHNSGVIHAGVYYRPGSHKARMCAEGRRQLIDYCDDRAVPYRITGKLVVATGDDELPRLEEIGRRCEANGVPTKRVAADELSAYEPYVRGVAALHVPSTGVIDFRLVCEALRDDVERAGGTFRAGVGFESGLVDDYGVTVETSSGTVRVGSVVNCAGLQSDVVARALGSSPPVRIMPFRGEFFELAPRADHLVQGLIYPVPDPSMPFLGVHATRGIDGNVHLGPNAVPALAIEGYRWGDIEGGHLRSVARDRAWWRLARRHWRAGVGEISRSASTRLFVRAAHQLLPELRREDLVRAPAGVRAQAVGPGGEIVDDFVLDQSGPRVLHVLNAPSPAATASLAIGQHIAARLLADAVD